MNRLPIWLALFGTVLGLTVMAEDLAGPKWVSGNGNQVKIATTDTGSGLAPAYAVVSTVRTPTITTASASGTVAAGARKLTFIFSSDFAGTVLGATFAGGTDASVTIDAPSGDSLAAVAYTRSAGSVRIVDVR